MRSSWSGSAESAAFPEFCAVPKLVCRHAFSGDKIVNEIGKFVDDSNGSLVLTVSVAL